MAADDLSSGSLNSSLFHMASSRWLAARESDLWQSVFTPQQRQFMYYVPIMPLIPRERPSVDAN